jgi:hypothetical protein
MVIALGARGVFMIDIFEFWSRIKRGEQIHPDDKIVFDRMSPERHGFKLDCLPGCFGGPLKTASVVLLYLSPGYSPADADDAKSEESKDYYFQRYRGDKPFRDAGPGVSWIKSRTKIFTNDYETVRNKFAVLNIGAYHSKNLKDYGSLLALPSSRVSLAWAQETLFPEAEAGNRIVICLRSAAYWGLDVGREYKGTLFAPPVNRGGYLLNSAQREKIIELVKKQIES